MESLILDYPEYTYLYKMRELLKEIQDLRYGGFCGFQRKGAYRFERGFGSLNLDIRCLLLEWMKSYERPITQEEVDSRAGDFAQLCFAD